MAKRMTTSMKAAGAGILCAALALFAPSSASAQQQMTAGQIVLVRPVGSYSGTADMQATVEMIQAAYVRVAFVVEELTRLVDKDAGNGDFTVNKAFISLRGMEGETMVLTCGIGRGDAQERDCSGADKIVSHAVASGGKARLEMVNDGGSGHAGDRIAIDVTYL